ncbi:hypothetical protein BH10ACT2_BH10ACT2_21540 [soil metagenome]
MLEFTTASASAKDPAALAATLTEKSADGWSVLSIVTTTSEVTAFLSREASSAPAASTPAASSPSTSAFTPLTPSAPASEPAGWAVAPEPSPTPAAMAPISTPSFQPAAATPAVPAGWYADPAGRFDLRYWDGTTWTEHVSRAGQQYTDSPTA